MSRSLSHLPDEILLEVLEQVSPDDLKGFALIDRRLHRVACSRLREHRKFLENYSSLDMFFVSKINPLKTILDLCRDARALYYPTRVDLVGAQYRGLGLPVQTSNDLWKEMVQEVTQITPLMRGGGTVIPEQGGERPNYVYYGTLLAICICLLPNIRAIRLPGRLRYNVNWTSVGALLNKFAKNGFIEDSHQFLGKLSKINIVFHMPYQVLSKDWLEFIATTPNLSELELVGLRGIETSMLSEGLRGKLSSIEELALKGAIISEGQFADFFRCVGNLRRFEYSHPMIRSSHNIIECGSCAYERVLDILRDNTGDTLEALSIELPSEENHQPFKTIQGFRTLKSVAIMAQSLQQEPGESLNLIAILPRSIEEIILTVSMPSYPPYTWSITSRRGPICSLKTFYNLRKLTLASHLLLQSDGKLLNPGDFLPDAIEEFTILSPAPLSCITNWKEHRQILMYIPTLQRCYNESIKEMTVGFETRKPSFTIQPQQSFHTDFSEAEPFDPMWKAVMKTFNGFARRRNSVLNIILVVKFIPNNSKALTLSDTPKNGVAI